ncbi:hypothetical protein AK88_04733 [Plasmodium fragile]|uniref:Schizont-infected cell agglutination C-terminal domain-containing protein n=1 Tax=Plasmodium fragile TaxID=5857 RepID=A0A0D9QF16_PLAFR|nr:uncharacterized protein AK88_04733 [Plasmodium fragile]KJP85620.1 hypothetical protein AK88_04733 [Plasmodium fragile]
MWSHINTIFRNLSRSIVARYNKDVAICEYLYNSDKDKSCYERCRDIINILRFMDGYTYSAEKWTKVQNNRSEVVGFEDYMRCLAGSIALLQIYNEDQNQQKIVETVAHQLDIDSKNAKAEFGYGKCNNYNHGEIEFGLKFIAATGKEWIERWKKGWLGQQNKKKHLATCASGAERRRRPKKTNNSIIKVLNKDFARDIKDILEKSVRETRDVFKDIVEGIWESINTGDDTRTIENKVKDIIERAKMGGPVSLGAPALKGNDESPAVHKPTKPDAQPPAPQRPVSASDSSASPATPETSTPSLSDKKEGSQPPQKEAEAPSSPTPVEPAPKGRSENSEHPPPPPVQWPAEPSSTPSPTEKVPVKDVASTGEPGQDQKSTETTKTVENNEQAEASGPPNAADRDPVTSVGTEDSVSEPGNQVNCKTSEDGVDVQNAQSKAGETNRAPHEGSAQGSTNEHIVPNAKAADTVNPSTKDNGIPGTPGHASTSNDALQPSTGAAGGSGANGNPVDSSDKSGPKEIAVVVVQKEATVSPVNPEAGAGLPDTDIAKVNSNDHQQASAENTNNSPPSKGAPDIPFFWPGLTLDKVTPYTPIIIPVLVGIFILIFLPSKYFALLGKRKRTRYRTIRDVPSPPLDEEILQHLQRGDLPPPDYGYTMVTDRQPGRLRARRRRRHPRVHKLTIIELHLEVLHECEATAWENVQDDYLHILVEEFMGGNNGHSSSLDAATTNQGLSGTNVSFALHPPTDFDGTDACPRNADDPDPCKCMETIQLARDRSPPNEDDPDPWSCMETIPLETDRSPPNEDDPWSCMEHIQLDAEQSRSQPAATREMRAPDHTNWINWIDRHKHMLRECTRKPWFNALKSEWKQYYQQHAPNEASGVNRTAAFMDSKKHAWKEWVAQQHQQMSTYSEEEWFKHLLENIEEETLPEKGEVLRVEKVMGAEDMLIVRDLPRPQTLHQDAHTKNHFIAKLWILLLATVIQQCDSDQNVQEKELYVDRLLQNL